MTELEAYCRADVDMTIYTQLWWDIYQWVRATGAARL